MSKIKREVTENKQEVSYFPKQAKACRLRRYAGFLLLNIGTARFELATSRTPSERATRLRYVPSN